MATESNSSFVVGVLLGLTVGVVFTSLYYHSSVTPTELTVASAGANPKNKESGESNGSDGLSSSVMKREFPSEIQLPIPASNAKRKKESGNDPLGFTSHFELSQMEKYITLSDEEKALLKDKLEAAARAKGGSIVEDNDEETLNALRAVVGDERANAYMSARDSEEKRRAQESVDQSVYTFTRKLNLSSAQEAQVREVFTQAREETRPFSREVRMKMRETMAKHSTGSPQEIQAGFDAMRSAIKDLREKRRAVVNERLRPVLSDDQYNSMLEAQASDSNSLWGLNDF